MRILSHGTKSLAKPQKQAAPTPKKAPPKSTPQRDGLAKHAKGLRFIGG